MDETLFFPFFFLDDPVAMVKRESEIIDLTKMIPLKKIKGYVIFTILNNIVHDKLFCVAIYQFVVGK